MEYFLAVSVDPVTPVMRKYLQEHHADATQANTLQADSKGSKASEFHTDSKVNLKFVLV